MQSPELTVRETVVFSARLRLDPKIVETDEEKLAFVDQILEEMELSDLANVLVGTEYSLGLSFEQKKRLSIAVELAASPSMIFLDEPTSGLDARSALLVVRLLRKICDGGRTCVATVSKRLGGLIPTVFCAKHFVMISSGDDSDPSTILFSIWYV